MNVGAHGLRVREIARRRAGTRKDHDPITAIETFYHLFLLAAGGSTD